jgi:hypothetical protein
MPISTVCDHTIMSGEPYPSPCRRIVVGDYPLTAHGSITKVVLPVAVRPLSVHVTSARLVPLTVEPTSHDQVTAPLLSAVSVWARERARDT